MQAPTIHPAVPRAMPPSQRPIEVRSNRRHIPVCRSQLPKARGDGSTRVAECSVVAIRLSFLEENSVAHHVLGVLRSASGVVRAWNVYDGSKRRSSEYRSL